MAVSVSILAIIISLHLIAFVLAIGSERRHSSAKVMPDKYDESTYCVYGTDASTFYGLSAFGLLLISQVVVSCVTKCLCFGKGLLSGSSSTAYAIFLFVISWISFLGAKACLIAGSARNAYHTKYRVYFGVDHLSCATIRKGVFAAGAALTLLSLLMSILYYWAHSKVDTGGWEKHRNEGAATKVAAVAAAKVQSLKKINKDDSTESDSDESNDDDDTITATGLKRLSSAQTNDSNKKMKDSDEDDSEEESSEDEQPKLNRSYFLKQDVDL